MNIDSSLRRKLLKRKNINKRKNKLTHEQIHTILTRYADGARALDLAREHGVSQTCVRYHISKACEG